MGCGRRPWRAGTVTTKPRVRLSRESDFLAMITPGLIRWGLQPSSADVYRSGRSPLFSLFAPR
jgi:hypothetical protein